MARTKDIEGGTFATVRASKGGRARAAALTPTQRSDSARKASNARWEKSRSAPAVTVSSASAVPCDREVVNVTLTYTGHDAAPHNPHARGESWHVNARSYVIRQHETESYTQ